MTAKELFSVIREEEAKNRKDDLSPIEVRISGALWSSALAESALFKVVGTERLRVGGVTVIEQPGLTSDQYVFVYGKVQTHAERQSVSGTPPKTNKATAEAVA